MIEYKLDEHTLMGGWFISEKVCDNIVKHFKANKQAWVQGLVGEKDGRVDKKIKESYELPINYDRSEQPFYDYRIELQNCLDSYIKKYPEINSLTRFAINTDYKIQYYKKEQGFKTWHSEVMTKSSCDRVLVFMTYLNDVEDGGTIFKYQNITMPAKKGLTVIWPAHFSHVHKGQITNKGEKYIVTGWYNFI
tara:strand:+ start:474 stop:1049 length:576 start_codon:yes stop_codon:yes gene_type:complete